VSDPCERFPNLNLSALTTEEAEVVMLRCEGLSCIHAAELLGCSRVTVWRRWRRSLTKLAQQKRAHSGRYYHEKGTT